MNTSVIEYVPEFKEKIEKVKSQIEQLDVSHQRIKHCGSLQIGKSKMQLFF